MQKTDLDNLMRAYYTDYYRTQLGLPDAAGRAESRLHEAEHIDRTIDEVERWANHRFGVGQKVLIVGGGTGAEFIAFNRRGCETHAVEPNPQAVEIAREQALYHGYDPATFLQGVGEQLPYADNSFDFVWCFTVLEHVQNVEQCITEMIRVVKPGHRIFLATPDYRQFYEKHYKMMLPLFLPRWMQKCWLAWKRRPTGFIDTLQFVNSRTLTNLFQQQPVVASFVIPPWPRAWLQERGLHYRLIFWLARRHSIQHFQNWLLLKLEAPE